MHALDGQELSEEHADFFEKRIRPIFTQKCQGCHNPKAATAGLDLTTGRGFRKGADSGQIVVPGDPENSRLLQVIGYLERIKMPPTGKLRDDEIAAVREWVRLGAPWPADAQPSVTAHVPKKRYTKGQQEFWSFSADTANYPSPNQG